MGSRNKATRNNRRRQKSRAKEQRAASMALAKPRCPECEGVLIQDAAMPDLWNCGECGVSMLRLGPDWLTQIEAPILSLPEYVEDEEIRKAA